MPEPVTAPKVLISYSHDSPEHMARVLALSDRLRAEGIDSQVDQYETSPPEGWPRWTLNQVEWADFVLVACTETYHRRFRGLEERGRGRGVNWEGIILTQDLYDEAAHNTKFIPVLFEGADEAHIPVILRGATFYVVSAEDGYEALYRRLTNQPRTQKPGLGKLRPLPQRTPHAPGDAPPRQEEAAAEPEREEPAEERDGAAPPARPRGRGKLPYALIALAACLLLAFGYWRLVYVPSHREPTDYTGKVSRAGGGVIPGAVVRLQTQTDVLTSYTDSNGMFFFRLNPGVEKRHLRVEADGFVVYEQNRPFADGTYINVPLTRVATPTPTPATTPTPSPAPTRRPVFPRPSPVRIPCTVERRARGLC